MQTTSTRGLGMASIALLSLTLSSYAQQVTATPSSGGSLTVQLQPYQGSVQQNSVPVLPGTTAINMSREAFATSVVGLRTQLRCEANGPPSGGHGGWSSAAGRFGVLYSASAPIAGVLRLTMTPACYMNPPYIDVGDDQKYELIAVAGSVDVPVVLGPQPLVVSIFNEVVNFAPGVCVGTSSLEFLPTATKLKVLGTSCGPELNASLVARGGGAHELALETGSVTLPLGVYIFGTAPASWAYSCPLLTRIDVAIAVAPVGGKAGFTVQLPSQVSGQFRIQYVELSLQPFALGTSHGLQLRLP